MSKEREHVRDLSNLSTLEYHLGGYDNELCLELEFEHATTGVAYIVECLEGDLSATKRREWPNKFIEILE